MRAYLYAFVASFLASVGAAEDCGPEAPCEIEGGSYYLRLPEGAGPHPVMIWYHGHRGSGASIHRGGGLQRDFLENGFALLAPNGAETSPGVRSYPARTGAPRDDIGFTFAALQNAQSRADLDMDQVFVSGFSAGGSMAWLLACQAGNQLAGMVSVAGALRVPNDTTCAGLSGLPVMQVHGFKDAQVPYEGRGIRIWHQGSVWDSLERARVQNECRSNPDEITIDDRFRTRSWDVSCSGAPVLFVEHDGGHGLPQGWTERAYSFFQKAKTLD